MDPAWVAIVVGIVSSLVTAAIMAAINFAALKAWMARREEREATLKEQVVYLTEAKDDHAEKLGDHELRLGLLERGDRPPYDYAR